MVIHVKKTENIATKMAPIYRTRYVAPLTPRRCREEWIESGVWETLRTQLDRLLSTDQADVLEAYFNCESLLLGGARCTDYCGDRVQRGVADMSPLPDGAMARLREHAALKLRLATSVVWALSIYCRQQRGDEGAPSDAQCGLLIDPSAGNAAALWRATIARAAQALVGIK